MKNILGKKNFWKKVEFSGNVIEDNRNLNEDVKHVKTEMKIAYI